MDGVQGQINSLSLSFKLKKKEKRSKLFFPVLQMTHFTFSPQPILADLISLQVLNPACHS